MSDQTIDQISGTATLDARVLGLAVAITAREGRSGRLDGSATLHPDNKGVDVRDLTITLGTVPWRLVPPTSPPAITWTDAGGDISPVEFVNGRQDERVAVSGTWRANGSGALRVRATHVYMDTLSGLFEQPARYGGLLDLDATLSGTREDPRITSTVTVTQGRVERVNYQQLTGQVNYANRMLDVDLRLDQSPGVWVTVAGKTPLALFTEKDTEQPIDVAIKSSGIDLGLLDGLTDVIRNVSGRLIVDLRAVGTNRDPHFSGTLSVSDAGFVVTETTSAYKNGRAALDLHHRSRHRRHAAHRRRSGTTRSRCAAASARTNCASAISEIDATARHSRSSATSSAASTWTRRCGCGAATKRRA